MEYDTICDLENPENEIKPSEIIIQLEGIIGKSRIYEIFESLELSGKNDCSKKSVIKLVEIIPKAIPKQFFLLFLLSLY